MTKNDIIALSWAGTHLTNPYHNLKHCVDVYNWCEKILKHDNIPMSLDLQFATIFHDYNHSGGRLDDDYNIPEAIRHICEGPVREAIDNVGADATNIVKLINITKYIDGGFPKEPETFEEMVIRDADLMTSFLPWPQAIEALTGLYTEFLIHFPKMTKEHFWKGNVTFMKNAKFYTNYGKMRQEQLDERLTILEKHWHD
jgi:hypothetical protein